MGRGKVAVRLPDIPPTSAGEGPRGEQGCVRCCEPFGSTEHHPARDALCHVCALVFKRRV